MDEQYIAKVFQAAVDSGIDVEDLQAQMSGAAPEEEAELIAQLGEQLGVPQQSRPAGGEMQPLEAPTKMQMAKEAATESLGALGAGVPFFDEIASGAARLAGADPESADIAAKQTQAELTAANPAAAIAGGVLEAACGLLGGVCFVVDP
jgi:hypothetical protein